MKFLFASVVLLAAVPSFGQDDRSLSELKYDLQKYLTDRGGNAVNVNEDAITGIRQQGYGTSLVETGGLAGKPKTWTPVDEDFPALVVKLADLYRAKGWGNPDDYAPEKTKTTQASGDRLEVWSTEGCLGCVTTFDECMEPRPLTNVAFRKYEEAEDEFSRAWNANPTNLKPSFPAFVRYSNGKPVAWWAGKADREMVLRMRDCPINSIERKVIATKVVNPSPTVSVASPAPTITRVVERILSGPAISETGRVIRQDGCPCPPGGCPCPTGGNGGVTFGTQTYSRPVVQQAYYQPQRQFYDVQPMPRVTVHHAYHPTMQMQYGSYSPRLAQPQRIQPFGPARRSWWQNGHSVTNSHLRSHGIDPTGMTQQQKDWAHSHAHEGTWNGGMARSGGGGYYNVRSASTRGFRPVRGFFGAIRNVFSGGRARAGGCPAGGC